MPLTVTARWPGSFYLGHTPDGTPEPLPTPARVFSALVHSAGTAHRVCADADGHPDFVNLDRDIVDALLWLEHNPPNAMHLPSFPDFIPADRSLASKAYRRDGVLLKEDKRIVDKTTSRPTGDASWCSAPVAWFWEQSPPPGTVETLDALCADISHLGEGDSPAILEVFSSDTPPLAATHRIAETSFFDRSGAEITLAAPGRLAALERQYRVGYPDKRPTAAQDRHNLTTRPHSEQPESAGLRPARLIPFDAQVDTVPWPEVVLLPVLDGPVVLPEKRVAVAVHLHRALIAAIGQECPPSITGKYGQNAERPANRVALHYLPVGLPLARGEAGCAHFAVLVPQGIPDAEKALLYDGIDRLRDLRTRVGTFKIGDMELVDGAEFWSPNEPGQSREWRVDPVAIPERVVRGVDPFDQFSRAALLSLTNVFRNDLDLSSTVDPRQAWIVDHDIDVLEAEPYLCLDPTRFVHRTNHRIPAAPYTARLDLGTALPDTAICAIGQSRHLGGGLLVPVSRRVRSVKEKR